MNYNKIINKNIIITGGTGSFGKAMVKELLQKHNCKNRFKLMSK